jgi:hypothetical protein
MATEQTASLSGRTLGFGLLLAIVLFAVAGVASYFGTRGSGVGALPQPGSPVDALPQLNSPVVSITLPIEEPDVPSGPHQQQFQVACTICHSTRLVLTQPPFSKAKWGEIVKKMADVYGAPISVDDQGRLVEYLTAIRGQ